MTMRYHVPIDAVGMTLEHFLLRTIGIAPRAALKKAFLSHSILLNTKPARRDAIVSPGDLVEITAQTVFERSQATVLPNASAELDLLVESPDVLVVNKPGGIAAHPLHPIDKQTVLNAVTARFPECAAPLRPERPLEGALIHRLDRGTSGALAIARNPESFARLRAAWRSRDIEKVYLAWIRGTLECADRTTRPQRAQRAQRIELRLAHDPKSAKRMTAIPSSATTGWPAVTSIAPVSVISAADGTAWTLLLIRLHTGVMHQIRATLATLGSTVVGDSLYRPRAWREADLAQYATAKPLDADTARLFETLRQRINLRGMHGAPDPAALAPGAFFLHAFWLRTSAVPALANGVLAPTQLILTSL